MELRIKSVGLRRRRRQQLQPVATMTSKLGRVFSLEAGAVVALQSLRSKKWCSVSTTSPDNGRLHCQYATTITAAEKFEIAAGPFGFFGLKSLLTHRLCSDQVLYTACNQALPGTVNERFLEVNQGPEWETHGYVGLKSARHKTKLCSDHHDGIRCDAPRAQGYEMFHIKVITEAPAKNEPPLWNISNW